MPNPARRTNSNENSLPRSLPLLLARRVEGQFGGGNIRSFVARQFAPQAMIQNPQLVSPPTNSNHWHINTAAINSLHVDRVENRFVLAGGSDAIVSIYDISKWGSEDYFLARQKRNRNSLYSSNKRQAGSSSVHKPIASSQREPPRALSLSDATTHPSVDIPSGHASPISKVQWYPVDSGAFLSSSRDGSLLVWDTDSMAPVAQCTPFDTKGIGSFHVSPLRINSAVVASLNDPSLKLVDIRSGASSHTLLGHAHPGISCVQWAPHNDVILASGGLDGTIRLWDVRKAGSRACVTILNQDITHPPSKARAYSAHYSHLPKPSAAILSNVDDSYSSVAASSSSSYRATKRATGGVRRNRTSTTTVTNQQVAPNNYRPTENSSVLSHSGPVSALSFGAKQDGHSLVSAGQDGNLHIWDLRGNGHLLPLRFMAPGHQPAVSRERQQVPMLLTQFSSFAPPGSSPGACWIGNGSNLLGYSLERGGMPQQVLQGHLHTVTAIDVIEATMQVLTAGKDGMILTWGKPDRSGDPNRKRKVDEDSW